MLFYIYLAATLIVAVLCLVSLCKSSNNFWDINWRKQQGYIVKTDKALAIRSILIPTLLFVVEIWMLINLILQAKY